MNAIAVQSSVNLQKISILSTNNSVSMREAKMAVPFNKNLTQKELLDKKCVLRIEKKIYNVNILGL